VIRWAAIFLFLLVSSARAQDEPPEFRNDTYLQSGFEYDSNVYKSFRDAVGDAVFRALLKNRTTWTPSEGFEGSLGLQLGGKKFIDKTEKDVFITYAEVPLRWRPLDRLYLSLTPDLKYQNENNAVASTAGDANEDYFSTMTRLMARVSLPWRLSLEPSASYTYLSFDPLLAFSYHREQGGAALVRTWGGRFVLGGQYEYSRQQFLGTTREDADHEISGFVQFLGVPFASVRYTYEDSTSSDPNFDYTNHRLHFLLSIPFGRRTGAAQQSGTDEDPGTLFAVHLLGTLQFKQFPSVFISTVEGTRFLLTGAEDENFNSVVAKFSVHLSEHWTLEAKYTRYSNGISSEQADFARTLVYGGARYRF
jgi:hypothetical protein